MPDNRSRGGRRDQISYKEVDSDVDMDSEEEKHVERGRKMGKKRGKTTRQDDSDGDEYTVGDSHGTNRNQSKSNPRKKNKKNKKPKYTSRLLLELPFDLFFEVCDHLDTSDLFNLAKVNKSLHKIVVSRSARSIWSSARKRDGYELLEGMGELRFAVFLSGRCCDGCGARSYLDRSNFLRTTLCKECRAERTVTSDKLKESLPDLHPRAIECVRFQQGRYTGVERHERRRTRYMVADLEDVNNELAELEEEDELAGIVRESQKEQDNVRSRRGRSSIKQRSVPEVQEESESLVQEYVERKVEWVKKEQQASLDLITAESEASERRSQDYSTKREEKRAVRREVFDKFSIELEDLDWNEEDIDTYERQFVWSGSKEAPLVSPSANPNRWAMYLAEIRKGRIHHDSNRTLRESLKPFYESLKSTESPRHSQIFPHRGEFEQLPSIKRYWANESSQPMSKLLWLSLLPSILADIDRYCQDLRIEAIRAILAAQRKVSMSKLSMRPTDYPQALYRDSFFDLATSLFYHRWTTNDRPHAYPSAAFARSYFWRGKGSFSRLANSRTTSTVQAIVQAAGLDSKVATAADLGALGRRFTWDNSPVPGDQDKLRTWDELISKVSSLGPNKSKYKDGSARTDVTYWPEVEADGQAYLDEAGDGPGEVIDSDEEEGEGSEGTRSEGEDENSEEEGEE